MYNKTTEKLNNNFSPQKNVAYEVYNFRQAKQQDGESLNTYYTHLKQLATTCGFCQCCQGQSFSTSNSTKLGVIKVINKKSWCTTSNTTFFVDFLFILYWERESI